MGILADSIEIKLDAFFEERSKVAAIEITSKRVTKYGAVNATGRLLRSLEVNKPGELHRQLKCNSYAYYLVNGRKPGTPPPISPLKEWARAKGLPEGVAYGVQQKITKEGTEIHKQGGSDLFADATDEKAIDEFFADVGNLAMKEVSSLLFEGIGK